MKKLLIYLGIIVGLFVVLYAVNQASLRSKDDNVYGIPASKLNPLTVKQLDDPNYQNIILPDDLKKKLQNKESFFVYFFSPDCPHCVATTPHLAPLAKELGVDMKMFNLLEFREGWNQYFVDATPTLVYFKDGKVENNPELRIVGGMTVNNGKPTPETYDHFKNFLNKYK